MTNYLELQRRLRDNYPPPDRTVDEQRQIAQDIWDAADAIDALRSLCAEAAQLYGSGGIFPVNGDMSQRLELAAQGIRLPAARDESKNDGVKHDG